MFGKVVRKVGFPQSPIKSKLTLGIGQNSIQANKQRLKGLLGKPKYPRRSTGTQLKNKSTGTCKSISTLLVPSKSTCTPVGNNAWLGTARPVKLTWQVGVSGNKGTKQ